MATRNSGDKIRMVTVDMTPTTDFYMIVRQRLDAEGMPIDMQLEAEVGKFGNFEKFPGFMYDSAEQAESKAAEYMKQRARSGERYRYFIMHPVSVVVPKMS